MLQKHEKLQATPTRSLCCSGTQQQQVYNSQLTHMLEALVMAAATWQQLQQQRCEQHMPLLLLWLLLFVVAVVAVVATAYRLDLWLVK